MAHRRLYRTEIVIWSDDDPEGMELEDLAREATDGNSICTKQVTVEIDDINKCTGDDIQAVDSFFYLEGDDEE
jgi:hypothetical protein